MHNTTPTDSRHCVSDTRCRAYDRLAKPPAAAPVHNCPLCADCLTAAERDIRSLVYDYVDLEQLQAPSLSQALNMQPAGKAAPPMPLNGAAEALQAEIHHVTTLWADELRRRHRLARGPRTIIVGAWHTTRSNPPPQARRLPGAEVADAVATLTPRLTDLARNPPVTVYPTGCDDDPTDLTGWEAVHQLQHLHQRARGMLGRTHRTTHLPGTCSTCGLDELHRDDPRHQHDPCDVYCTNCHTTWPHTDYQQYVTQLVWPTRAGAAA
ncbi:hypothetical protein ACH4T9_12525 [Micromonospora sp. NPDC020750]|uniref:hypothetical protein n=1 Tax=unclassified Micromonospora TaxID=2617518 RepID=UPI00379A9AA0